jgi:hypothetical protein
MTKQIQTICSFISFCRGLYPRIFKDNKDVLNSYLINSFDFDKDTNSPSFLIPSLNKNIPNYEFPIKPTKSLIDRQIKEINVYSPKFTTPIFPIVIPESLNRKEFYKQILSEEWYQLRLILGGDYTFVRPQLKESSNIFKLNENSPQVVLHLTLELCSAWKQYLDEEIEKEHFSSDELHVASKNNTLKQKNQLLEVVETLNKLSICSDKLRTPHLK